MGCAVVLPSLKQLQYFVALYEHKHFGRAAAACHVTQSTLSAGLKELESALDTRLVERTPRMVLFTPMGVRLVRHAQDLLVRARELATIAHAGVVPLSGRLRLSLIPTIAPFLLPSLLPALRREHPALELVVHEEMSRDGCAGLSSGAREAMILALPYDCGDFDYAPLFEDPIMVAMASDEPLARRAVIAAADLPQDRLLLLQEGHCLRDHALRACGRSEGAGGSPAAGSIHTLVRLVEAGMGVALLPQMAVDAGVLAGAQVAVRPLVGVTAHRSIALAWRRNSPHAEDCAVLARTLRKVMGAQPASSPAMEAATA
jgi:LysR family transcriptional regulator, hydrogen peroxide-inducible genes activator